MSKHVADFEMVDGQLYLVLDRMRIAIPPEAKPALFGLVREAMDEGSRRTRIGAISSITKLVLENKENKEVIEALNKLLGETNA